MILSESQSCATNPSEQHVVILGGGTAGWMAASLFAHHWKDTATRVTLIESSDIGIIGVGEGSTPYLRDFFRRLGISEQLWMPECNATYKSCIRFPGWSTHSGYTQYTHPFFMPQDFEVGSHFFTNANLRRRGVGAAANPDDFFIAPALVRANAAPIPKSADMVLGDYAYHFDSGLLGSFLKKHALGLGVTHQLGTVAQVNRKSSGDIASLLLDNGILLEGDFFVDCSGFASVLIDKALGETFIPYADNLLNDRAIALPSQYEEGEAIAPETVSRALSNGWSWKIPLTNRYGNGYVYSSAFIADSAAETELRQLLGKSADDSNARFLRMRVGRVEQHWRNNCLAVGLSQGFIEPLEATALMLVQFTLFHFLDLFEKPGDRSQHQRAFNQRINQMFEGVRDYVVAHYKLNSRMDTDYWRCNREQTPVSDCLQELLQVWDLGGDFDVCLKQRKAQLVYSRASWYCLLAGMGRFPQSNQKADNAFNAAQARDRCSNWALKFPEHREYLLTLRQRAC